MTTQEPPKKIERSKSKGTHAGVVSEVKAPPGSSKGISGDQRKEEPTAGKAPEKSSKAAYERPCIYCEGDHSLADVCEKIKSEAFGTRIRFLQTKGLCFGCLKPGHQKQDCRRKSTCKICNMRHPKILHISKKVDNQSPEDSKPTVMPVKTNVGAAGASVTFAIVPVKVRMRDKLTCVNTYAFLDSGSNVSFCTERLMRQLGATGKKTKLKIDTMGEEQNMTTYMMSNMILKDLQGEHEVEVGRVYTKVSIPVSRGHIPKQDEINKWAHLTDVHLPVIDAEVGLLIGSDVVDAYSPLEIRTGPSGSPYGCKTRLRWMVHGVVNGGIESGCHRAEVTAVEQLDVNRSLDVFMNKFLNMDFPEYGVERREASQEDKTFMAKVESSLCLREGHYEMRLPFRDDNVRLPDNIAQARQRLGSLKKKLSGNPQFYEDYQAFMGNMLSKGFAELVPGDEVARSDGRVWYVPHHGLYHPKKPGKIRVVFDCAAEFRGISLNKLLLSGPDLTNSLLSVLVKFRQDEVAVTGDIESMFYQVRVGREDVDCLRYLWWPEGDLSTEPQVYRMLFHIFGATSSPACANVALRKTAADFGHGFSREASESINSNFYVDDYLKNVPTEEEALSLVSEVSDLCRMGGFRLTKWSSNRRSVLKSVLEADRAKQYQHLDLDKTADLPTDRTLGVSWEIEKDNFVFRVSRDESDDNITRRLVLSRIGSVFEPLGFISPVVLKGKILLQSLTGRGVPWDQRLEEDDFELWRNWESQLGLLSEFSIPRCLRPPSFGRTVNCQMHHFADASDVGYGVVSYVRFVNSGGETACSLLTSRSRVSPLKRITIPRLELTAATAAVRLHNTVATQLEFDVDKVYFWTDSMNVLRYLKNNTARFYTFVANRVSFIRETTDLTQWRFVPTTLNPADVASRGLTARALVQSDEWITGPGFLVQEEDKWPNQPEELLIPDMDPEVRNKVTAPAVADKEGPLDSLIGRFSSWKKLKRVVTWIMIALSRLRVWAQDRKLFQEIHTDSPGKVDKEMNAKKRASLADVDSEKPRLRLTTQNIEEAEAVICRVEQRRYLGEKVKTSSQTNPLYKLDVFVDNGLMRVGGQLGRADIPFGSRHPIVIPAQSAIAGLILRDAREAMGHLGRNSVLAAVRQSFWIIKASTLVRKILSKCVPCRKYRARSLTQKMADLPPERTIAGEHPFRTVGMDYFGPFLVKRGRASVKRYSVIFTCFTTRAVHLEVATSLDTSSCINAIRRFAARRGPVSSVWSDNGTNLVGAERELREELEKVDQQQVQSQMLDQKINWHFNPPAASHFGGLWERMIRTTRKVLYGLATP